MPWFWSSRENPSTDTYSLDNSTFIEGISDDTLLLFFFTVGLIGLWIYYSRRERNTSIHPDNRQDVQLLRERTQQHPQVEPRTTDDRSQAHVGRPRHDTCPICLSESSVLSVETNCGHLYCGKCIITFWKFQSNWTSGMNCPVCRQAVTVLLTCFTADEQASQNNTDLQTITNDVKDFNRRFSGAPRTYLEYFYDIPVLIPHLIRQIFTVESLAWTYRIRILTIFITVIAYVISPLDILPEGVFGILGLFDDFFILICAALYMIIAYREYLSHN